MKRRLIITVAAIVCMLATALSPPRTTLASWSDAEYATGSFTASVVQKPTMNTCVLSPGLLGTNPVITVTWTFPTASPAYAVPANIAYWVASGALPQNLTQVFPGTDLSTTGPISGVYTTQYRKGLLSGLLGGTYGVYLQTVHGSGWVSTRAEAVASMGLLGANPQCTITPP